MTGLSVLAGRMWGQPYLLLFLTVLFWSGNLVMGRAVAHVIPPVTLAEIRWAGAFLIILPFAWKDLKADWPIIRKHIGMLTILALSGISAYNTIAYWGLQHTQAVNANLMQTTAPVLIAFWCLVLYREPLTRGQVAGIAVAMFGVVTIVLRGDLLAVFDLRFNIGDIALIVAMGCYSLYTALLRKRPPLGVLSFLAVTIGWGAFLLLPAFVYETAVLGKSIEMQPLAVLSMVYVVLFPSLFAYLCYNRGVELIGPNRAAPAFFLFPVLGSLLAFLFLGERLQSFHFVGTALILAGVVAAQRKPKKRVAVQG